MKQILTARLKIIVNPADSELLSAASLAVRNRLDNTSAMAENKKICSSSRWGKRGYDRRRTRTNERSARVFKVPREIGATDAGLPTKALPNSDRLKELSAKAATATIATEGLSFQDGNSGFELHAKLTSARSICQDGIGSGHISSIPDVWETETKADAERAASAPRPDKVLSSFGGVQTQSPTKL